MKLPRLFSGIGGNLRLRRPSSKLPLVRKLKSWRKWSWKQYLKLFGILVVAGLIFIASTFAWFAKDLPTPGQIKNLEPDQSTIIYDRNGEQLYDITGDQQRIILTSQQIPDNMKHAIVAVEDKSFYHDYGISLTGIIRAGLHDVFHVGSGLQGASTITQQYVKNALLSPDRTIVRKIKEAILSIEIDRIYSKDQILTLYLNEIPFGSNAYGIEAASQLYFGKSIKDGLTISQAATLAAMVQAPTYYSPYGDHVDDLISRKNIVIDDMVAQGYISKTQGDQAKKDAPLSAKDFAAPHENIAAPHFVMYVKQQLVNQYGEDTVDRGGLRVTTTLDSDLQAKAESAVKTAAAKGGTLDRAGASNTGLVSVDPKTGQILAMVGSVDYFDQQNDGNFNTTTALRQPGSAGKPIVYATLFKGDYSPSSILWDVTTNFNGYQPADYDKKTRGPVTIRAALGNSLNIPAVKALQLEGVNNFIAQANSMGISSLSKDQNYGLSLALGGGAVKLVDLTNAYSVFANGGTYHPLTSILKVEDSRGKVIDSWQDAPKQVLKPEIAYEINNVLSDANAKRSTFGSAVYYLTLPNRPAATKTGTTDDYRDAWTIGYTPTLVTGVWVGNNSDAPMDSGGADVAAPIWHSYMEQAMAHQPVQQFDRPSDITDMTVDLLSGGKPTPYSGQLVKDIFAPWQIPTQDDNVHVPVKLCKGTNTVATDATPTDQIETKVYTVVHSRHPDDPAWENPVQDWAKSHNFDSQIPTDKCTLVNTQPTVTITSPNQGDTLPNIFTIAATVSGPPDTTNSVTFSIDSTAVGTAAASPYAITANTNGLSAGTHTITAKVDSSNGQSATTSITVTVAPDTTPPGPVSNITAIPAPSGANLSWTNPSDTDLSKVIIYSSLTPSIQGVAIKTVNASPSSSGSATVTGLVSGETNYLTLVAVDAAGNPSASNQQLQIIPQ